MNGAERLVYWYLRLNGFLLLENFIVHPDEGSDQRTDVDLIGVRFKNRSENMLHPMKDDLKVQVCPTFCNIILAEVKKGMCSLNGPWTNQKLANMQKVLSAIGCFPPSDIEKVAFDLYKTGTCSNELVTCRIIAFGDHRGELDIPDVIQILFNEIVNFIYNRFIEYGPQKSSTSSWPSDGVFLRKIANRNRSFNDFEEIIRIYFDLRNS